MDEVDFMGWNQADWQGVFARALPHRRCSRRCPPTAADRGIDEHIDAMKAIVETWWHACPARVASDQLWI
jgi:hypothetical protein